MLVVVPKQINPSTEHKSVRKRFTRETVVVVARDLLEKFLSFCSYYYLFIRHAKINYNPFANVYSSPTNRLIWLIYLKMTIISQKSLSNWIFRISLMFETFTGTSLRTYSRSVIPVGKFAKFKCNTTVFLNQTVFNSSREQRKCYARNLSTVLTTHEKWTLSRYFGMVRWRQIGPKRGMATGPDRHASASVWTPSSPIRPWRRRIALNVYNRKTLFCAVGFYSLSFFFPRLNPAKFGFNTFPSKNVVYRARWIKKTWNKKNKQISNFVLRYRAFSRRIKKNT